MRRTALAAGILASVVTTAMHAQRAGSSAGVPAAVPSLLVFITIDQLRPDYFARFGAQLTGGLARLSNGGAVYQNAAHDHAITETAPGHASVMSGRFPKSTGIIQNSAGVEDPRSPLLGHGGPGASPIRFRGTVLYDWMSAKYPASRALSVSRKDRGAILPLGRAKQQVLWYSPSGAFTTSRYYADSLPAWVEAFNARKLPQRYAGQSWTPLLPDREYPEPDSVLAESNGRNVVFPHVLPADSAQAARVLPDYPFMDVVTLQLALAGLNALNLGAGPHPDLLAVSLSATDAVGHRYGPDSKELHDHILRLDRALGAFLDSLYKVRDSSTVIVTLTADHGVAPYPGVASHDANQGGIHAEAVWDSVIAVGRRLVGAGVDSSAFEFDAPFLILHRDRMRNTRVNADSVVRAFAAAVGKAPGVLRADLLRDLAKYDTTRDAIARRWLHMIPDDLPVDVVVTLTPYSYWGKGYATHGSPHDYDAKVPIIFYGAPFKAGRNEEFARTVDIAPTLAAVLGVPIPAGERLDGRPLRSALR